MNVATLPPTETTSPSLARLAIHTMTTKPLPLASAIDQYASRGIQGISVWVEALEGIEPGTARRMLDDAGMHVPALVRGGFFCDPSRAQRRSRIEINRRHLATARELSADQLVLVVGGTPGVDFAVQRGWVRDGIEAILPDAKAHGIRIAIEPLHPMYAADKSCINRIAEARTLCSEINHPLLGVAVDVYHVWWDKDLPAEITRLGEANQIFGFHICDWRVPTRHLLTDRALMGDGCIDIRAIRQQVEAAGFDGWNEVEIFSEEKWAGDQGEFLDDIVDRYRDC